MLIYMAPTLTLIAETDEKLLVMVLQGQHKQTESGIVYVKIM